MTDTSQRTQAERQARVLMYLACLLIPTLSLLPFGSIWLWQHGYLVYWAIAAALVVLLGFWLQRWLLPPPKNPPVAAPANPTDNSASLARELGWSPLEEQAMDDVNALSKTIDLDQLTDWDNLVPLGRKTIETVAHRLHPGRRDPVWQFTPPEALAIIEREAGQMLPHPGEASQLACAIGRRFPSRGLGGCPTARRQCRRSRPAPKSFRDFPETSLR